MIDIKATGLCTGCTVADLETEWLDLGIGKTWRIRCLHEEACERARDKSVIVQDDDILRGIKAICKSRPSCAICRYYIESADNCGIGYPYNWELFGGKEEDKG